ncbi:hypothetical protein EOPP23_15245 [Endozoicomonas sp. OPT23]|uniref:hybrid sensor histidine kinase/response regulator n=1 Tax=Endozoicomonas sp. OPT23 TaxID=2072845 RepID=UPI00129AD1F8|nr:7TM-DISM domain-containing protein [Endozoicomonas sp. OPT23]MRI34343.1 hypothetical protein [Endozoicomonas sp. OPT23]
MKKIITGKLLVTYLAGLALLLTSVCSQALQSTIIQTSPTMPFTALNPFLEIFRTPDKKLDVQTLADNPLVKFEKVDSSNLNLAYSDDRIWLRFTAHNPDDSDLELFVESAFTRLDYVNLHYLNSNNEWVILSGGDRRPYSERPLDSQRLLFPIKLPANSTNTFYIDIHSTSSLHIPLFITSSQAMLETSEQRYKLDGLFYGISLMVILTSLFVSILVKKKLFYYYFLSVLAMTLSIMALDGSGYAFWPNAIKFQEISIVIFQCLNSIFTTLFARKYLDLKRAFPKADLINRFFIGYCLIALIASPFLPYVIASFSIIIAESLAILWICGQATVRAFQRYKPAYIFLTAWMFSFTIIAFVAAANLGISHNYSNSTYALKIAFAFQFVIMLAGLGYQIHLFRVNKEAAERAAIVARTENNAKNELLAKVSHEIRTPLNGILGIVELLSQSNLNKTQLEQVKTIQFSGKSLLQILNDILDHTRLDSGNLKLHSIDFSPEKTATKVVDIFTPLAQQKNIEFIYFFDPKLPESISGDPARLRQILTNLLSNAIKFTQSGTVQLRVKPDPDLSSRHILFEIEDSGPGISEELRETLFDRFTQGEHLHATGSGLGLNISRQLAALMNGEIGYKNTQNGTLFWLALPY